MEAENLNEQNNPALQQGAVSGSVLCVICGKDTGLTIDDLDTCDPVCSEKCSDVRREHYR